MHATWGIGFGYGWFLNHPYLREKVKMSSAKMDHTVDGQNPAPGKDDNYPIIDRVLTIPGGAGFLPSTVWQKCQRHCNLTALPTLRGRSSFWFVIHWTDWSASWPGDSDRWASRRAQVSLS